MRGVLTSARVALLIGSTSTAAPFPRCLPRRSGTPSNRISSAGRVSTGN